MWATSWALTKLTAAGREEDRRAREEGGELMISKSAASTTIYVLDKDEALDFYVNKLGLEVG